MSVLRAVREPGPFYLKDVYVSFPELYYAPLLKDMFPCPTCKSMHPVGEFEKRGYTLPREIRGMNSSVYVVARMYKHKRCGANFNSNSNEFIRMLPRAFRDQSPWFTEKSGVTAELLNFIVDEGIMNFAQKEFKLRGTFYHSSIYNLMFLIREVLRLLSQ